MTIQQGIVVLPTSGLVAHYPFNGNANDMSGNNLQDFSMSAFLQIDDLNIDNNLLSGANPEEDNEFNLGYNSIEDIHNNGLHGKGWRIVIGGEIFYFAENKIMDDHQWHHIVIVRKGSLSRLYIDGNKVGDDITVSEKLVDIEENGLILGQDQDCVNGCFDENQNWAGGVDDLRIFNRALNEDEVKALALE